MSMFDVFGEFNSAEDLNQAAEGLFNEGDFDNIYALARENGIPEELAKAYIDGDIPFLADACIAACGKIDVELADIVNTYGETAVCIAEYIKSRAEDENFARLVRRKGKSLKAVIKGMEDEARKMVKKKTGMQMACIPPSQGFRMVREYYQK